MFVPEWKTRGVEEGRNVRMVNEKEVTHSGAPPGLQGEGKNAKTSVQHCWSSHILGLGGIKYAYLLGQRALPILRDLWENASASLGAHLPTPALLRPTRTAPRLPTKREEPLRIPTSQQMSGCRGPRRGYLIKFFSLPCRLRHTRVTEVRGGKILISSGPFLPWRV